MKKLALTICLTLAVLLGSTGTSWGADYEKGLVAYQSGDFATALRELTPFAEQGNADAQHNLGWMYGLGKGVPQDYKTAMKWFILAAEQGIAKSQHNLGWMYRKGLGVPQDYKTAVKWYTLAAEQGNTYAQNNLGLMYHKGQGVLQNYVYAHMWGNIAASNGNENGGKLRDSVAETMIPRLCDRLCRKMTGIGHN
ncbi:MAG: tetratricopeptide repeat protein, partial [Gammaproteobacteria bacterium]|nr:tetratricopeptide repeat protein [Gammaproteobacteria bacterium]